MSDLRERFLELLDKEELEQVYQTYLEENTQLIPREFVQNHGIHFDLVLRKLAFGADYKTDFFYMSKSSDSWHLVFIEIEKPQSRYFKDNSNDLHPDFQKGLQQINRWRAWLSDANNLALFLKQLHPMHLPLIMRRNPAYAKFVLVTGRRQEYHDSDLRRSIIHAEERPDFHIISFDSLAEGLAQKHECYIAVRHNEYIEIQGDRIVSPDMFGWIEPTEFKVSQRLREELLRGPAEHSSIRCIKDGKPVEALPWTGQRIRV